MTPDPFDPAALGRPPTDTDLRAGRAPAATLPRPAKGERYLGGPVPLSWLARTARLPGKAFPLGCALWYAAIRSKGKSPTVALSNRLAQTFGVGTRTTRARALEALIGAALVSVETRPGRAPRVTILPAPEGY